MDNKLIYLARHGDIGLGRDKRFIGQTDLPLSDLGKEQATSLKELFDQVPLVNIYCSDLIRSKQTADIIASAHQINPISLPEMREMNMGKWEGKLFSEIRERFPAEYKSRGEDIANNCAHGGESFIDCAKRVIPLFEKLAQSQATPILIIGHASVNRVIIARVLGLPLDNIFHFEQNYGCLNLITRAGQGYRLKSLNCFPKQVSY